MVDNANMTKYFLTFSTRTRLTLPLLITSLFILALPNLSSASDCEQLTLTGSSTLAPLMSDIAELYEQENRSCRVNIQTGGSSRGIADAKRGLADLGMSSRSLYSAESQDVSTHSVAMDGVSFIVNSSNEIRDFSSKQIKDIFSGKTKNWKELGGHDSPIVVINRAKGRSEYDLVKKFLELKPQEFKADVIAGENQQCVKIIANNKDAISYLSIGTALFESSRGTKIALSNLDSIAPTIENLNNNTFPIIRPLILISKKEPEVQVRDFLDFALSSKVQHLVSEQSFVSIH